MHTPFRSIRWTMQMWHAAILVAVLIPFAWVVFYLLRLTMDERIDADLNRISRRLMGNFNPPRRMDRGWNGGRLEGRAPRGPANAPKSNSTPPAASNAPGAPTTPVALDGAAPPEVAAGPSGNAEGAAAGPDAPSEPPPRRRQREWAAARFEVPEDLASLFDQTETDPHYYYLVWDANGEIKSKSKSAPEIEMPSTPVVRGRPPRGESPLHLIRQRGEFREVYRPRPPWTGGMLLVGRSIQNDLAALHEKGWMLFAAGLGVLAIGMIGGGWFSWRAIKPIEAMSAAAAEISLSNLSRRIDVTGTETELNSLARTLNQMFDRLESSFGQQVRFTADASHELRTPLAVILSHTELALSKSRPPEELRETIETCRRSALRMKSLVESLLTLARFDSGEQQLECRTFDLGRVAGDCAALVRPLAEQRKISLVLDLAPASYTGDQDRIVQVVTNLLTNAIRYNHDQGQVSLSTRSTDCEVILSVADTGIGIAPEHLPYIFERFYRVDRARSRRDGGVGLGLAICKSIAEAHGGELSVSSEVGRGTTFEMHLPKNGPQPGDELRGDVEHRRNELLAAASREAN